MTRVLTVLTLVILTTLTSCGFENSATEFSKDLSSKVESLEGSIKDLKNTLGMDPNPDILVMDDLIIYSSELIKENPESLLKSNSNNCLDLRDMKTGELLQFSSIEECFNYAYWVLTNRQIQLSDTNMSKSEYIKKTLVWASYDSYKEFRELK